MKRQSGPFMTIIFACAVALAAVIAPSSAPLAQNNPIAQDRTLRLVAFGDSLTAGYGLPETAAFPVVLEKALKAKGTPVGEHTMDRAALTAKFVENASLCVARDAAAGAVARLWEIETAGNISEVFGTLRP